MKTFRGGTTRYETQNRDQMRRKYSKKTFPRGKAGGGERGGAPCKRAQAKINKGGEVQGGEKASRRGGEKIPLGGPVHLPPVGGPRLPKGKGKKRDESREKDGKKKSTYPVFTERYEEIMGEGQVKEKRKSLKKKRISHTAKKAPRIQSGGKVYLVGGVTSVQDRLGSSGRRRF